MKLSSLLLCAALLTGAAPLPAGATDGHVCFATNPATGAIASLSLAGDTTNMNWMLRTDGSQYAWVTPKYGWGLGYFSIDGCTFSWQTPTALADGGRRVEYVAGGVRIEVERSEAEGGFAERFTFVNEGAAPVRLTDMGIYTPFNDNYPDARTCLTERCHAHIWPGGAAAYVEAQRMSGRGSEVGLMLTQGNVVDYDIWERGPERANSNFRGVVALCPADTTLGAGGRMTVGWRVFACDGPADFRRCVLRYGGALAGADRYVATVGDTVRVALQTAALWRHLPPLLEHAERRGLLLLRPLLRGRRLPATRPRHRARQPVPLRPRRAGLVRLSGPAPHRRTPRPLLRPLCQRPGLGPGLLPPGGARHIGGRALERPGPKRRGALCFKEKGGKGQRGKAFFS